MFDLPLSVFFSLVTPCALAVVGKTLLETTGKKGNALEEGNAGDNTLPW